MLQNYLGTDPRLRVDLQQQGVAFEQEPRDESWGWREARLRDPAGNQVRLYQAGEMRRLPPWRLDDA